MSFVGTWRRALARLFRSSLVVGSFGTIVLSGPLWLGMQGSALASNLLTNPGFESGDFNTGSNWVLAGELQIWDCGEAHTGACSLASAMNPAGGPATTFQFVDTVPGQRYNFFFFFKKNRNALLATVTGSYEIISGSVGSFSTVVAASITGLTTWEQQAAHITATGPLTRISFSGEGFGPNAFNIDDVGLIPIVPEPSTWAMLLAGLIALAGIAQRNARR